MRSTRARTVKNASVKNPQPWVPFADPYLRWADATDFAYFYHERAGRFGILVEFASKLKPAQRIALQTEGVSISVHYEGQRFVSADLDIGRRDAQLNAVASTGALRVELATPVAAPRVEGGALFRNVSSQPDRLIGVIDDGCPFAHDGLMSNGLSRVHFLWDQGATEPRCGSKQSEFGYGFKFNESSIKRAIERGTSPGTGLNEDAVYEAAAQDQLRPLASHGAHVLGLAVSSIPPMNRISPSRFTCSDATEPPSLAIDPNANAALAFVQIPRHALDDSSGRWLGRNILDGLHAILWHAKTTKSINRVTINVSYGPQTGPHDGTSLLESAIDDLVKKQEYVAELFVTLPIGNSFQSRARAEFNLGLGGGPVEWHVPPDSETPAFLEVWLPREAKIANTQVVVSSPDGETLKAVGDQIVGSSSRSWQIVTSNFAPASDPVQWVVLIALGATGGYDGAPRPPYGRWSVSVTPRSKASGNVHACLARNDYNFGGLRRGRPSYLWHPDYDPEKFMRSREEDPAEFLPPVAVRICSAGTMSGLATGAWSNVAAGYRIADKKPALYSSAGPSRGKRRGPDWAYPTDESRVFPGLISWGNRSGTAVRLVGTSSAAPQYARDLDRDGRQSQPPQQPEDADPRLGWGLR